jgi:hypothetical protein
LIADDDEDVRATTMSSRSMTAARAAAFLVHMMAGRPRAYYVAT